MAAEPARILIICTSGLGQFVQALGTMAAVRAGHDDTHIALLTAPELAHFASTAPYFDEVISDETLGGGLPSWLRMRARLSAVPFTRIYDLDGTAHTRKLFWLMFGRDALPSRRTHIMWSGDIPGTALHHDDPRRGSMHNVDCWMAQLKAAGVGGVLRSDMSWVARQVTSFSVPFRMNEPFVLLSVDPGPGSPWPGANFGELARLIAAEGRMPVLAGLAPLSGTDRDAIHQAAPEVVDLVGKITVNDLVFLAWAAKAAVGADNGLMHVTAAAGCHSVVLYDGASDPALVGQRGERVVILRRPALDEIPVGEVMAALHRDMRPHVARRLPVA